MGLYVLSQEAVADLDELYGYGEHQFGSTQAIPYLTGLSELFGQRSTNPGLGRQRNAIKKGLLSISHGSHVVFYRSLGNRIRIVRVLYGGRDLLKVFE